MLVFLSALLAIVLGGLVLQGNVLLQLRAQQVRIDQRIGAIAGAAANVHRPVSQPAIAIDVANIAPAFTLPNLAGTSTSLAELTALNRPVVLIFVAPRCGPCYPLLPDIGGWLRIYGDRLTIALISSDTLASNLAMTAEYGIEAKTVLLQNSHEIGDAYNLTQAPAAVVVLPGGQLRTGNPAYGVNAVRQLVADTLGLAVPPRAGAAVGEEIAPIHRGDRVPALRRPDIDGEIVNFGSLQGETTLLLFWNPGCGHCQALLPAIKEQEAIQDGPRLLVVTRGPIGLNKDVGLTSPMVQDDDQSLARAFDVKATPSAVVIDSRGIVASEVFRGGSSVRELLAQFVSPVAMNAD